MVQRDRMPSFAVHTASATYQNVVERGVLKHAGEFLPRNCGKLFIVTEREVWRLAGPALDRALTRDATVLFFPGGEPNKKLSCVEVLAEQMIEQGADRTSVVIAFGGGIVTDVGGFLAAIFMRGVPVLQLPTTLLAQVDAALGGKTGVNLASGKNLIGSFHQPLAVLIDPRVLSTLAEREYRAGLFEVIKCGIIRDPQLFDVLATRPHAVLAQEPETLDRLIAAAVRIKAEVVTADEREGDLRRILNFGHTIGHAIEAETRYRRFLHGEAVGWGMLAAVRLSELTGHLSEGDGNSMRKLIQLYGPIPSAAGIEVQNLVARLASDKKTLQGKVHFVLPTRIGAVKIVSGITADKISQAISESLQ